MFFARENNAVRELDQKSLFEDMETQTHFPNENEDEKKDSQRPRENSICFFQIENEETIQSEFQSLMKRLPF